MIIDRHKRVLGFADTKPSETVHSNEYPCLCVSVEIPMLSPPRFVDFPAIQYKDSKGPSKKQKNARILSDFLKEQKKLGLQLSGFYMLHPQLTAAQIGLSLLEEIEGASIEKHYDSFRLKYTEGQIDLAQAVALEYYLICIRLGILKASYLLEGPFKPFFVALDRMPGESQSHIKPGSPIPISEGMKFIHYILNQTETGLDITKAQREINISAELGTIDWWRRNMRADLQAGKTHPYFSLPDWLSASAISHEYPDEMCKTFKNRKKGKKTVEALRELHATFKSFRIWNTAGAIFPIRGSIKNTQIPEEAKDFIHQRALLNKQ